MRRGVRVQGCYAFRCALAASSGRGGWGTESRRKAAKERKSGRETNRMHVERRKARTAEGAGMYSRDKSAGKQKCMLLAALGRLRVPPPLYLMLLHT